MDLKPAIEKFFSGEVLDDQQTLDIFSKDASLYKIKPKIVVFPEHVKDISKLIQFVNETNHTPTLGEPVEKLTITPRSAGTDMSGGAINDSILMEMTQSFNHVVEIGDDYAVTQPGVFYRDFEKKTLQHDLLLPCYPASRELCTVGGIASNNSAGEKTLLYGQTERYVKRLKAVLRDGKEYTFEAINKDELKKKMALKNFEGELYRTVFALVDKNRELIKANRPAVSKNSTGYLIWDVWDGETFDMTKILVGSQGTLGVLTEIKFHLIHPKKYSKMLVMFLKNKDMRHLGEIVNKILAYKPESFESYDDYTISFAMKFLPDIIKVFKPKNLLSLGWHFMPEMWMTLTGGMPKMVLLADFRGDTEQEVHETAMMAQQDMKHFQFQTRLTQDEEDAKKYWVVRRESFNLLRKHTAHRRTAPFIDDIIVRPEFLPEFLPKLNKLLKKYNLIYTVAGHVGNGNFHIIPLMDLSNPKAPEVIRELGKKVYDLVFEYKGSMSAEHNDGLMRGPYLSTMYPPEIIEIYKAIKELFDPDHIFNPHKKITATFDYSMAHLDTQAL